MLCRRQRPCPQSCTFSVWQTTIQSTSTCGLALPVALPLACLARCHNYSVTGTGTPDCFTTDRCKQSLGNLACLRLALLPTHTGTYPENASHLGRTTAITTGSNSPCGLALCTCCRSLLPLSTRISQCTTGNATPGLWDRFRQGVGPQQACLPFLSCMCCLHSVASQPARHDSFAALKHGCTFLCCATGARAARISSGTGNPCASRHFTT